MTPTTKKILITLTLAGAAALAALSARRFFFPCGNLSLPVVADTVPPPAPAVVSAAATRCKTVMLTWNKVYDIHSVLRGYKIYKDGVFLAETQGTQEYLRESTREFAVTSLPDNASITFSVSAVDIRGLESPATPFPAVTTHASNHAHCTDTTPPSAPAGFTVTRLPGVCRSVDMALGTPSTDGQSGLDHYTIYRDGMKIANTTSGSYGAERFGLTPGQTYDYWLRAVDKAGNESAPGNVVHYSVPDCTVAVPGGNLRTLILAVNLPGRTVPSVTMADIERLAFGVEPLIYNTLARAGRTPSPAADRAVEYRQYLSDYLTPFNAPSMKGFYLENSYGRVHLVKTGVLGWIQLSGAFSSYCPQIVNGMGTGCNSVKIRTDALALAVANFGLPANTQVDRFVLVVNGQAENSTGGNIVMLSSFNLGTAIHEMGHTFGIAHGASWLGRKFDSLVGIQLALPLDFNDLPFGAANLSEYGDPRNRMGGPVINHFAAFQKELAGFLPPSQVTHVRHDGNFRLEPVETISSGPKVLRIAVAEGRGTLKAPFVTAEYRNGRGYDADGGFKGVQLRLVPERFFGAGEDDTIYMGELTDAFPVFKDWHRGMKYTLVERDDSHAVVHVCGLGFELVRVQ